MKKVVTKAIEALSHPLVESSPVNFNFGTYSIFNLINVSLGLGGKEALTDKEEAVEKLFWNNLEKGT